MSKKRTTRPAKGGKPAADPKKPTAEAIDPDDPAELLKPTALDAPAVPATGERAKATEVDAPRVAGDDDDDDDDDDDEDEDDAPVRKAAPVDRSQRALTAEQLARSKRRAAEEPDYFDNVFIQISKHGALPALLLLTIGIGIVFRGLFHGEIAGDDLTFHFAESARLSECIRAGDFDWWNPSANAGYASAYYYQVIPQLASALPAAIFGHLLFWFQLSNFLPLVLAPAAAYRGMRLLGASPWQSFAGAFCVAMMNGESRWGSGAAGSFQVGLYTQTWALSAFPLALGYGGRWLMKGDKLAPAIAWGAFVGLCHPFAVIGLAIALVVGVIARMLPTRTNVGWPSWVGTAIALAGVVLLLLPGPVDEQTKEQLISPVTRTLLPILVCGGIGFALLYPQRNSRWVWRPLGEIGTDIRRLVLLGVLMIIAWMPVWLPLLSDYAGFGGFPHRVNDEVGPGFTALAHWFADKKILDFTTWAHQGPDGKWIPATRLPVLTYALPLVIVFARTPVLRWLWAPALLFALALGIGPHMSTTQDDLLPMVRFLGAMQTLLALGIGAGAVAAAQRLWVAVGRGETGYVIRTLMVAVGVAAVVFVSYPGSLALQARVHTMDEYENQHHDELLVIGAKLATLPPGRKQAGPGTENHWWNLLTFVYGGTPSLLQMGGGGLQSSPNYDYLWTQRDFAKNAWIYDAPYVVFLRARADRAPPGETVFQTANYEIRKLPSPGLVSPVEVTDVMQPGTRKGTVGHEQALDWLKGDLPLADHVLGYYGYGEPSGPPDGRTLSWHRQMSPGDQPDIVAQVQVSKTTTFVFRESWHPRWHGYVDGEEVSVRRVTPDFPAIDVPPGTHEISLRFERPWWDIADWLAWPGTALAAFFALRWYRRRATPPEARVVKTPKRRP